MELSEFKDILLSEIGNVSTELEAKENFIGFISRIFLEAEEIDEEIIFVPYSNRISRKQIQLDGYLYNDLSDVLTLYIIPELALDGDTETLTIKEAENYFKWTRAFIEESSTIITEEDDDNSSPAYGLAIDIANHYSKDAVKYKIIIITDREMSKNIKIFENSILDSKPVEYHIWDISRLMQLYESRSGKEEIIIKCQNFTTDGEVGIPCIPASQTSEYTSYLCNIPGFMLAKIYNHYEGRLLEGNVRSYLQARGKVNKGIINTIQNKPEMFFAYNNGIAATASKIKIENINGTDYITEIEGLQIVNGGQTTASLALSMIQFKRDDIESKLKKIFVPMKLSVVKSLEKSQQIIQDISKYANSQNKVSEADLWSNHPFHIRMEDCSRRIIAPPIHGNQFGTKWFYERANGQYKQATYKSTEAERKKFEKLYPKNQMFTKTDLAKYMNIILLQPHIASKGNQKSFAFYAKEISAQWDKDEKVFNDDYFKKAVASVILFRGAQDIVKRQGYNSYKANIIAYTLSKIIATVEEDYPEMTIDYRAIWQKQELSEAWEKQIESLSKEINAFLQSPERSVDNVTEWAKHELCWTRTKRDIYLTLNTDFVDELISKEEAKRADDNAKKERKIDDEIDDQKAVYNFGVQGWKKLLEWNIKTKILSPIEISFVKTAIYMERRFPTEKQCSKIIKILNRAREEGFPE